MNRNVFPPIPQETIDAARAILEEDNFYLMVGDRMNDLFRGISLNKPNGWEDLSQPMLAMLYVVTIFQYIESLSDDQATEALETRVDWKYALHLPLGYRGMEATSLCDFRQWLLAYPRCMQTFQLLLGRLAKIVEGSRKEHFSLDAKETLQDVCLFSRVSRVWDALGAVLELLKTHQPGWLRYGHILHCYTHYTGRCLTTELNEIARREAMTNILGLNGIFLLKIISESGVEGLSEQPKVVSMKAVWGEQYEWIEGRLQWRKDACASCLLSGTKARQIDAANHNQ